MLFTYHNLLSLSPNYAHIYFKYHSLNHLQFLACLHNKHRDSLQTILNFFIQVYFLLLYKAVGKCETFLCNHKQCMDI